MNLSELRIGLPGDYRPFAMHEPEGYQGLDVDIAHLLGEALGLTVTFVATSWPTLSADLVAQRFDIAAGGVTIAPERLAVAPFLPGYAPFSKVALVNREAAKRLPTPESLNAPTTRVVKNPGGTNEAWVLTHLKKASVTTHNVNHEIPGLVAEGKFDVMITDLFEAALYAKKDKRLVVLFSDVGLTPRHWKGFWVSPGLAPMLKPLTAAWRALQKKGALQKAGERWDVPLAAKS